MRNLLVVSIRNKVCINRVRFDSNGMIWGFPNHCMEYLVDQTNLCDVHSQFESFVLVNRKRITNL